MKLYIITTFVCMGFSSLFGSEGASKKAKTETAQSETTPFVQRQNMPPAHTMVPVPAPLPLGPAIDSYAEALTYIREIAEVNQRPHYAKEPQVRQVDHNISKIIGMEMLGDEAAAAILLKLNPRVSSVILNEMAADKSARLARVIVGARSLPRDGNKSESSIR